MKRTDLHEYQSYCVDFLKSHPQAMLILEMGLGKSVITLTAILDLIADWNAGKIQLALISPASAGHGLNIQRGGHILIWFSLIWSLEMYQQTNARLWRQGQKETVTIHHLVMKDTIDEEVLKALAHKDETQAALIAAVKAHIPVTGKNDRQEEK